MTADDAITIDGLAEAAGVDATRLREWTQLGFFAPLADGRYPADSVERARLINLCLRRGITPEAIDAAFKGHPDIFQRYLQQTLPPPPYRSLDEAAESVELEPADAWRLWTAIGGDPDTLLGSDDVDFLAGCNAALRAGFPEEALLQVLRVMSQALERVADVESRTMHFYVHKQLRAGGVVGGELAAAADRTSRPLLPLLDPTVVYFHHRGLRRAAREDFLLHMAEESEEITRDYVPGDIVQAVAFVDLCSSTPLAEAMGDRVAAHVLSRFREIVFGAARRFEGSVVKQIGDEFMLAFPGAGFAVSALLDIEAAANLEPQFPAVRSGAHWGHVLYREGDYIGASVSLASRLVASAEPHQVLLSADARYAAHGLPDVEFAHIGKRLLKGFSDGIEVFAARSATSSGAKRDVDPVCGMELSPDEVAARLTLEGRDVAFCSQECLSRYVASPQKYAR